jgi:hypothetical protein
MASWVTTNRLSPSYQSSNPDLRANTSSLSVAHGDETPPDASGCSWEERCCVGFAGAQRLKSAIFAHQFFYTPGVA